MDGARPLLDLLLLAVLPRSSLSWRVVSVPGIRSHHGNFAGWGHLARLHKRLPHTGRLGAAGGSGIPSQKKQEEEPLSLCCALVWPEVEVTIFGPLATPIWLTQPCLGAARLRGIEMSHRKVGPHGNSPPLSGEVIMEGHLQDHRSRASRGNRMCPDPVLPGCLLSVSEGTGAGQGQKPGSVGRP